MARRGGTVRPALLSSKAPFSQVYSLLRTAHLLPPNTPLPPPLTLPVVGPLPSPDLPPPLIAAAAAAADLAVTLSVA